MKFYKDSTTGKWILVRRRGRPAGTCSMVYDEETGIIAIETIDDREVLCRGLYSDFTDEDGNAYASLSDFETDTSDFFVKTAGGITSGIEVINALGYTPENVLNRSFQNETIDYKNRIVNNGGYIDANTLSCVDRFICIGKRNGWYDKLNYIATFLGQNLNSALVPLKSSVGNIINTGFIDTDYDQKKGLKTAVNTKYLSTGYVPINNGLTPTNFSMSAVRIESPWGTTNRIIGSIPISGEGSPMFDYAGYGISAGSAYSASSNSRRSIVFTNRTNNSAGFVDGVKQSDDSVLFASTENTLQYEILCFKSKFQDGNTYISSGTIGFLSFGLSLTDNEAISLNKAIDELTKYTRTSIMKKSGDCVFFGDSNAYGSGVSTARWSLLISSHLGMNEINPSQQGRALSYNTGGYLAGIYAYQRIIDLNPEIVFISLGTNDMFFDKTTNGDPTNIAKFKNDLIAVINACIANRIKVVIVGVPWSLSASITKNIAYSNASAEAAHYTGVIYVDTYYLFLDTGNPSSFFFQDGVHYTNSGHKKVSDKIKEAMAGIISRNVSLDFGSIPSMGSIDLTIPLKNANVGNQVTITPPSTINNGVILSGFVSSTDNVIVRATNITSQTIDPSSGYFNVAVRNLF